MTNETMKNKKGLSGIVTILIVILLGLVAAGVVWVVINNTVSKSASNVEYGTSCMEVSVEPIKASCNEGMCQVTLSRSASGGEIDGIRMIFLDVDNENSEIIDKDNTIAPLATTTLKNIDVSGFSFTPAQVEIHVYFITEKGDKYVCEGGSSLNF